MKKLIICGIGSRTSHQDILNEMTKIGAWAKENGHTIRSGHAEGADFAFEVGAQEKCIAYIPWLKFNTDLTSAAAKIVPEDCKPYFIDLKGSGRLLDLVKKYHPCPQKLSQGALKLQMRNGCQLLGMDEHSRKTDVVVCFTPDGKDSGGTGQALRMAKAFGIPIINMYKHKTAVSVIEILNGDFLFTEQLTLNLGC